MTASGSDVGRFHGNALTIVEAINQEEAESKEQVGCLQCFQKIFCCSPRHSSLYDVPDTVVTDEVVKPDPLPEPPQPHAGDNKLEGIVAVKLISS